MDAYQILVVINSVLLALFLILSIVVVVLFLKLVKSLRLIVAKGEHLVDAAEEIGATFKRNAGAAALLKLLVKFVAKASKSRK